MVMAPSGFRSSWDSMARNSSFCRSRSWISRYRRLLSRTRATRLATRRISSRSASAQWRASHDSGHRAHGAPARHQRQDQAALPALQGLGSAVGDGPSDRRLDAGPDLVRRGRRADTALGLEGTPAQLAVCVREGHRRQVDKAGNEQLEQLAHEGRRAERAAQDRSHLREEAEAAAFLFGGRPRGVRLRERDTLVRLAPHPLVQL